MKFTLSWLLTHLQTDAPATAIADRLTAIGLELEEMTDPAATLAPFRVAHVVSAEPHPNADRLRACRVDAGDGPVSVVCGAPNARTGMKAVFAPPGSFIPGTGVTLKTGEIRGVESAGMLLSTREMGLGDDHSGILELPADAPVGASYAEWAGMNDPLIDISVTPNRGDALAVRGVARDLAASGLGTLKPWAAPAIKGQGASAVSWRIEDPCCQWVLGRTVRGVRNGPSPEWLQRRLRSIGLRPINALADITNFFTYDLGRPLHAFDAGRVQGGVLVFRRGAGETFRGLHGKDVTVSAEDCVIADAAGPQSLAGVVGGEATSCTEGTTDVFLECALFDPVRIALSGRRHGIVSDARQRFERGIDQALPPAGLDAAVAMVMELCGGVPSEVAEAGAEPGWQRSTSLRFERLRTLGGADVPGDEAVALLSGLGFGVRERDEARVVVDVPSWRNDIAAPTVLDQAASLSPERAAAAAEGCRVVEGEYDLVEEVLRLRGLDAIPPVSLPPLGAVPGAAWSTEQVRAAVIRRTLAGRGLMECVSFSFLAKETAALFGDAPAGLTLQNPIASDLDQLRETPVATLALAASRNAARGYADNQLFEVGPAYAADPALGVAQARVAAGLRTGNTPRQWATASRPVHALDAKGDALAALAAAGLPMDSLSVTADAPGWYHPGRSGQVRQGPKLVLATFGELHPHVAASLDLPGAAVAFEVFLDRVPEPKKRKRAAPDLPSLQPVRRDFAFLVKAEVPADQVLRAVRGADRALIAEAVIFDVFTGDTLPPGMVSVGVEAVLQPRERTLTEAEIAAAGERIKAAVLKATGGVLR